MNHPLHLRLSDAEKTRFAGESLADSLYGDSITIFLTGDLGAGKTTFLQGFAKKLGITDPLTSPTYALEQRYATNRDLPLIHLDLYRLNERDSVQLVESTEDLPGIRCIEWANRLPDSMKDRYAISLHLEEDGSGRHLRAQFGDTDIPTEKQIDDWRAETMISPHITAHCEAVARVSSMLADALIANGQIVRKDALVAAARLHDLLRFVDFKGVRPAGIVETAETLQTWEIWKKRYPVGKHEAACSQFLAEEGFSVLSQIVETHGLRAPLPSMQTVEQKLLFYADKRCLMDRIVTVNERFDDFVMRYGNGQKSVDHDTWYTFTKEIEADLFPNGAPDLFS